MTLSVLCHPVIPPKYVQAIFVYWLACVEKRGLLVACIVQESGFSIVYFPLQWKCRSVMVKTPSDTFEDIYLRPVISDRPLGLDQGVSHCSVTWSERRLEICEFTEFLVMLISIWRRLMDRQHVQPAECLTTHNLSVRLMYTRTQCLVDLEAHIQMSALKAVALLSQQMC